MSIGCALVLAGSRTNRIKWIFRFLGLVPLALSVAMFLPSYFGGGDPIVRLMALLPFLWGIVIVFLLGFFLLSCFGWKHYANNKKGESGPLK
jgi:hypothetical protein